MVAFIVKIRSLNKYQCGLELKNWKILTIVNQTTTETIHPEKLEWWNHQTPSFVLIFLFFFYKIASLNNSLTDKLKAYCITTIHSALQTLVENICFPFQQSMTCYLFWVAAPASPQPKIPPHPQPHATCIFDGRNSQPQLY